MRKIFFGLVVLVSLVFLWNRAGGIKIDDSGQKNLSQAKAEILRFAIISDSENDNERLAKALNEAKSNNASFVIGLGDFTSLGEQPDLKRARFEFDKSGIEYFVTPGDRDLWAGRDAGNTYQYFSAVFGKSSGVVSRDGVKLVLVDNADIYEGISADDWSLLERELSSSDRLTFVFSHKTPYHPQSAHIMGSEVDSVKEQATRYLELLEKSKVDGFFSGDLHFFAKFNSPGGMKITTVGAVNSTRNFQGPRFVLVKVYSDYTWEVEDLEI